MWGSLSEFNNKFTELTSAFSLDNLQNENITGKEKKSSVDSIEDKPKEEMFFENFQSLKQNLNSITPQKNNNEESKHILENDQSFLIHELELRLKNREEEVQGLYNQLIEKETIIAEKTKYISENEVQLENQKNTIQTLNNNQKKLKSRIKELKQSLESTGENSQLLLQTSPLKSNDQHEETIQKLEEDILNWQLKYDNLNSSNNISIIQLENKIKELESQINQQLSNSQKEIQCLKISYEQEIGSLNQSIDRLKEQEIMNQDQLNTLIQQAEQSLSLKDSQINNLENSLAQIQQEKLSNHDQDNQQTITLLTQQVQISQQSISQLKQDYEHQLDLNEKLSNQNNSLATDLKEKQQQYDQLKSNFENMKNKLKELMQKYSDLKTKSTQLESDYEHIKRESEKQLSLKENDLVKGKLKLETMEEQFEATKQRLQEISDRFMESQKSLQEFKQHSSQLSLNVDEFNQIKENYSQLQIDYEELKQTSSLKFENIVQEYESKISFLKENSEQLQSELSILKTQLSITQDQENNFENYKKRAQAAIKKANDSMAKLSIENENLNSTIEDLKVNYDKITDDFNQLQVVYQQLQADYLILKESSQIEITEKEAIVEKYQSELQELKDQNIVLRSDIQRMSEVVSTAQKISEKEIHGSENNKSILKDTLSDISKESFEIIPSQQSSSTLSDEPMVVNNRAAEYFNHAQSNEYENTHILRQQQPLETLLSVPEIHPKSSHSSDFHDSAPLNESNQKLVLVSELQNQLHSMKLEIVKKNFEIDEIQAILSNEKEEKNQLKIRVDELLAYLNRMKKLHDNPDSAINLEYLKNCIYKYMSSSELSEQRRLYPVIGVILNFTEQELKSIELALKQQDITEDQINQTIKSIGSSIESWFSSSTR